MHGIGVWGLFVHLIVSMYRPQSSAVNETSVLQAPRTLSEYMLHLDGHNAGHRVAECHTKYLGLSQRP